MKNNFTKIQRLTTLFVFLTSTAGYCATQSNSHYMVIYSNAFSRVVPPRWHISRVAEVNVWWKRPNKRQIEIDFRKEPTYEKVRLRAANWCDLRIVVLDMDFDPTLEKSPIPLPLFACTDKHQFYMWGVPASMNWSNSVQQLGSALHTLSTNAAVLDLSDDYINTYEKARRGGAVNYEYFRQKWLKSITILTNRTSKASELTPA